MASGVGRGTVAKLILPNPNAETRRKSCLTADKNVYNEAQFSVDRKRILSAKRELRAGGSNVLHIGI